jgi:hypothetical protein
VGVEKRREEEKEEKEKKIGTEREAKTIDKTKLQHNEEGRNKTHTHVNTGGVMFGVVFVVLCLRVMVFYFFYTRVSL